MYNPIVKHEPHPPLDIGKLVVFKNKVSRTYTITKRDRVESDIHIMYLYTLERNSKTYYAVEGESIKLKD